MPPPTEARSEPDLPLVLVVEDNPDLNALIAEALQPYCRVARAYNGREGLERATEAPPSLILSDIMMPDMDGERMVAELRRRPALADVPVMVLTARADAALRDRLFRLGVQDYLNKPFSVPELILRVNNRLQVQQRTRQELEHNEQALKQAQHLAAIGSWEWDTEADVPVWSDEMYRIFGLPPGRPPPFSETGKLFTTESWATLSASVEQALAAGQPYQCDAEVVRPDGSRRWVTSRGEMLPDAAGRQTRMRGTVQDITERKAIERALEASEARFRNLFDEGPVPLCYVDKAGVLIDRNTRFDRMFGYSHEEVRTLDDWWRHAYPDPLYCVWVLQTWNSAVEKSLHSGNDIEPCEYRVTCKDGSERTVLISGITLGDDFLATFFDVTARRMAENELRESRQRLALFIQHAPVSLAMFDREMKYLAVSRRWLEEYHLIEREILGRSHYEVFPEIGEGWKAVHRRGLAGETVREDADRFERADGSVQWLRWEVLPWRKSSGDVGGILIFAEDFTSYIEAREEIVRLNATLEQRVQERTVELSAANRELDSFAYAVSHDLRAPLRAMIGFSQALLEDFGDRIDGEARIYLDQIILASHNMSNLVDGLLTLSRSTRGELQRDTVDISALALRLLDELARNEPGRKVEHEVAPGLTVQADARMIEVVMRNLLGNAWKYTTHADPARIRVYAAETAEGGLRICVSDNGAGFDMAHANRLFQPFQRLHRQDEFPGIGIGLATVQRIIHRHGGEITADGKVGEGAIFCLALPERSVISDPEARLE